jgi:hypothetical protein
MNDWEQYFQRWPSLKKNRPPPPPVLPAGQMMDRLVRFSDEDWGWYAFRRELLRDKFSAEQKSVLIRKALACADEYAEKMTARFGSREPELIARGLGASVSYPCRSGGGWQGDQMLFALYTEPDKIEVFTDCIERAENVIKEDHLEELFGPVSFKDILLTHEVFHLVEIRYDREIFTRTEKIDLLPLKIIHNWSRIRCLGEIAAMRFAKTLLGLKFSPYVLDVFLLYLYDRKSADDLYWNIIKLLAPETVPEIQK